MECVAVTWHVGQPVLGMLKTAAAFVETVAFTFNWMRVVGLARGWPLF